MKPPSSNKPAITTLQPAIIVIFGITGDLAQKKLLPALYHLFKGNLLHEKTIILGVSRRAVTAEELLDKVELCVNEIDKVCDPAALARVRQQLRMHQMNLTDGADYHKLHDLLDHLETEHGVCMNRLYYLSIPPQTYGPIVKHLGKSGLNTSCMHGRAMTRLLVEKPFGYDLASAHQLIDTTANWFGEDQLYRIDHYLAKETVQNILAFRMYNPLFAAVWDNLHIVSVEITAAEQIGVEGRAEFYDNIGALRDFIQSHLLQLLAIITMELPTDLESDTIHASKLKLLQQISAIRPAEVAAKAVRGQYQSYRHEVDKPDSQTETYAAIHLQIENPRWKDVPILLQTGKALAEKRTDARIVFADKAAAAERSNELIFRIQPDEGISLDLRAKKPGFGDELQAVVMDFNYQQSFDDHGHPNAYERVLVDAVRGDHTLFSTSQEVVAAWQVVEAVVQAWSRDNYGSRLISYPVGAQLPLA